MTGNMTVGSGMPNNPKLHKYWNQRYNLFSRFDEGIKLDEESWWSVTPENIAVHIAQRVHRSLGEKYCLIVDGFCGVGGNAIQFARESPQVRVIGCDINLERIRMAQHNANVYGVGHQCDFICGDFMDIMQTLSDEKVDAVFLSPPWGGVDYTKQKKYSLNNMEPNGYTIVNKCRQYISDNIAFLMPRNVDRDEVRRKLIDRNYPMLEYELNKVGVKTKTITMYFGDLLDQLAETDIDD